MSDNIKPNYAYFERKMRLIADELTLRTYTSEELAREFTRLARTASEAAAVGEFKEYIDAARASQDAKLAAKERSNDN